MTYPFTARGGGTWPLGSQPLCTVWEEIQLQLFLLTTMHEICEKIRPNPKNSVHRMTGVNHRQSSILGCLTIQSCLSLSNFKNLFLESVIKLPVLSYFSKVTEVPCTITCTETMESIRGKYSMKFLRMASQHTTSM